MFCTTECWDCEDKNCRNYISKSELYYENQQLKEQVDKCISNEMKQQLEISNLKQENQQLKERIKVLENVLVRDKFNFSKPQVLTYKVNILESKLEQYKSVLDEIRKYMIENCDILTLPNGYIIRSELTLTGLGELFKILDKVKE